MLSFLREVVEFRGLLVSRYTAMAFEQEISSDERTILAAFTGPTADLSDGRSHMILPHHVALPMLRAQELQLREFEAQWPVTATASREAPG